LQHFLSILFGESGALGEAFNNQNLYFRERKGVLLKNSAKCIPNA